MNKNWKYYYEDGSVLDYLSRHSQLHRENGPAIESPGHHQTHWEFLYHEMLHNINGPAYCESNGELFYYINGRFIGKNLSNKEFQQKIKELVFK